MSAVNPKYYTIAGSSLDDTTSDGRGFAFYDPQPVEVSIAMPKKQPVLRLKEAKQKEQLKVWGLRK